MSFNTPSLLSSSTKKSVELAISSKARFNVSRFGVNDSRCPRLYSKSASGSLKSYVGGPERSEGLPYRGPRGPIVASLTAEAFLTLSDGEVPRLMAIE